MAVATAVVAGSGEPGHWTSTAIAVSAIALVAILGRWLAGTHRRWGGVVALGAGAVGEVMGVALGVRYVLAGGISPRSVAALVAAAAASVMLVSGAALVAGGLRWRWKVPTVGAAVAGVTLAGLIVAPGLLATNVPHVGAGSATPADRGLAYEDVAFGARDGVTLAGWYVASRNGAGIVLRHGSNATKADELDHLAVLAGAGFGVLTTDSRGHGGSGGQGMDFGWWGDAELRAAVDFLAQRPDVDPTRIGVVGISLGGMEAVGAAAVDGRISAVVAEGVTRRSAADLAWLPTERGPAGSIELGINWLQTFVTGLLTGGGPPPCMADSVLAADGTRFLLVVADSADEIASSTFIRDRAPYRVSTWVVPGAGHARGLQTAPRAWTATVVGFLSDVLLDAHLTT